MAEGPSPPVLTPGQLLGLPHPPPALREPRRQEKSMGVCGVAWSRLRNNEANGQQVLSWGPQIPEFPQI